MFITTQIGFPATVGYIEDILRPFMPQDKVIQLVKAEKLSVEVQEYTEIGTKAWMMKKWSDRFGPKVAWQVEIIMGTKESGWNANAYNCNTNGTVDLSWYQINSVHVDNGKLSLGCAADPVCSTEFAMDLYEEQGWCPWYGAKALGFCQ
ncbi:unnamed protein product [marine sediment metagenome]|uniref:Uncharacterized protein n=1 Tax=marine sediment metagenome TaxID=412755 RepID=X0WVG4_9ZZZZ